MGLEAPDIVEVISEHIELDKRQGTRPYYVGQCPFHEDTNPSFIVYPTIQKWVCYGCHPEYSDVYEFVSRYTNTPISVVKKQIAVHVDPRKKLANRIVESSKKERTHDEEFAASRLQRLTRSIPIDKALQVMLEYDILVAKGNLNAADMLLRRFNV